MFFPIIAACTYSLSMVLAKKTAVNDSLFQQTFHVFISAIFGASIISILIHNYDFNLSIFYILSNPWVFNDYRTLELIIFISIVGGLGLFCLIGAYRLASPLSCSILEYIHLIFAIIVGYFIFSEIPDLYSFIGIFLIVLSGIYIVIRENKREELMVSETNIKT